MNSTSRQAIDEVWMRRCIELAERARGKTSPNPMVGAVVVAADGTLLAEGFHRGPGLPHAEVEALAPLGGLTPPGATLYVNLEPCNHFGRTPPCARAVVASGVSRVVYGMRDPIAGHGGGAQYIAAHGIAVETGTLQRECEELNARWVAEMMDSIAPALPPPIRDAVAAL